MSDRTRAVLWYRQLCDTAGDKLACFAGRLAQGHGLRAWQDGQTRVAKKA